MKTLAQHMADSERDYFRALMRDSKGSVARAAEVAGVHRSTLYSHARRLFGIQLPARGRRGNDAWRSLGN